MSPKHSELIKFSNWYNSKKKRLLQENILLEDVRNLIDIDMWECGISFEESLKNHTERLGLENRRNLWE